MPEPGAGTYDSSEYSDRYKDGKKYLAWAKDQLEHGLRYRREFGFEDDWERLHSYYRCLLGRGSQGYYQKTLPVHLAHAMMLTLQANVFFKRPSVRVEPRLFPAVSPASQETVVEHEMREARALALTAVLNWLIQETGLKETLFDIVKDPTLKGVGALTFGQAPSDEETVNSWHDDRVKPSMPWFSRVAPENLVVPFGTQRLETARGFFKYVIRSYDDLKRDKRYNLKSVKPNLGPRQSMVDSQDSLRRQFAQVPSLVGFWEWHDKQDERVCSFTRDGTEFMRTPLEDRDQVDGLPLLSLQWGRDTDVFWDVPLMLAAEPQLLELNEISTQMRYFRSIQTLRIFARRGAFKQEDLDKLMSGVPLLLLETDIDPKAAIEQFKQEFPEVLPRMYEQSLQMLQQLFGLGRMQLGQMEPSGNRTTASEARLVARYHEVRVDMYRDAVSDLISKAMRRAALYLFESETKRVVPIIGPDALVHYVRIDKGEELKDEFTYKVAVEEMTQVTQAEKRQDLLTLIGQLGPNVDVSFLLDQLLKQFDWLDVQRSLPVAQGQMSMQEFSQIPPGGTEARGRMGGAAQKLGAG